MQNGPKISIITACYNAEKTIEQTIQSVLSQTYDNIEYIIVDGASTDSTMDIVNKYVNQINIIISERDSGIYDAFNKGAKAATGDYVQYLNADDYLIDENTIFDIQNAIQVNNNPILLYGGIVMVDEVTQYKNVWNRERKSEELFDGKMIPHPATFLRKDIIEQFNYFDTSYKIAADFDLIARIYKQYAEGFIYFSRLVSIFRLGGMSSFIGNQERLNHEMKLILAEVFKRDYEVRNTTNEEYFKIWLEKKYFEEKSIAQLLVEQQIKSIAIWGSGRISNLLVPEMTEANIEVKVFIDNDIEKQGMKMSGVEIVSPKWLEEKSEQLDAIVFGFEGFHEASVKQQINNLSLNKGLKIYSWRQLLTI